MRRGRASSRTTIDISSVDDEIRVFESLRTITTHKILRRERGVQHFSFAVQQGTPRTLRALRQYTVKRYSEFVALAASLKIKIPLPRRNRQGLLGRKTSTDADLLNRRFEALGEWLVDMLESLRLVYDDVMAIGGLGNPSPRTQLLLHDVCAFVRFLNLSSDKALGSGGTSSASVSVSAPSPPRFPPRPPQKAIPIAVATPVATRSPSTAAHHQLAAGLRRQHQRVATPRGLPDEFERFTNLSYRASTDVPTQLRAAAAAAAITSIDELRAAERRLGYFSAAMEAHRSEIEHWLAGAARLEAELYSTISELGCAPAKDRRISGSASPTRAGAEQLWSEQWQRRVREPLEDLTPPALANVYARGNYLDDVAAAIETSSAGALAITASLGQLKI